MFIQSWKFLSLNSVSVQRNQIHGKNCISWPGYWWWIPFRWTQMSTGESTVSWAANWHPNCRTVSLHDNQVTWVLTRSFDLVFVPESSIGSAFNEIMDDLGITHLCSTWPARMNTDTHERLQKPRLEISTDKTAQGVDLGDPSLRISEMYQMFRHSFGGYQNHINLLKIAWVLLSPGFEEKIYLQLAKV